MKRVLQAVAEVVRLATLVCRVIGARVERAPSKETDDPIFRECYSWNVRAAFADRQDG